MVKRSDRSRDSISIFPWWAYGITLVVIAFALYAHTANFGYTDLDDTIFIREYEQFNRMDSSYLHSFSRGVFNETNDTYYRPLLLNSFVFDRHREGKLKSTLHLIDSPTDSINAYHWTNIFLHLISVLLLFFLLREFKCSDNTSFILSMIFAVHPVLAQAVIWIPGRNDTLLAVFILAYMLSVLAFTRGRHWIFLPLQMILYLAALFTKETGVIAAPAILVVLLLIHRIPWKNKRLWIQCLSWIAVFLVWIFIRGMATVKNEGVGYDVFVSGLYDRLPLILQYLGKTLLPVNLAVVPYQDQTTIWYGVVALVIYVAAVMLTRDKDWRAITSAIVWFFIFLLPVLIVPKALNREAYEHRLYLPMIGLLLLIANTVIIKGFSNQKVLIFGSIFCMVMFVYNYSRSEVFSANIVFWESAVETAPSSAYCKMMLGARYYMARKNPKVQEGAQLIRKAYAIDSTEKYVNYYMGNLSWDKEDLPSAEYFYNRELLRNPQWAELYFRLARCAIERKDLVRGRELLERDIELNPYDAQGSNNLLLVYLDTGLYAKAHDFVLAMKSRGMDVQKEIEAKIESGLSQSSATPK